MHRSQDILLRWKPGVFILLRDNGVPNPDCEFTSPALHEFRIESRALFYDRCHTDSARAIVSDFAVSNPYWFHAWS